jgi:hypothetical protein
MRYVSDKGRRENENTYFMFDTLFQKKNGAVYEIMWKILVELDRSQWQHKSKFTHTMLFPCRAHSLPLPCRATNGSDCVLIT